MHIYLAMIATYVRYLYTWTAILEKGVKQMSVQTIERMVEWIENNVAGNPTLDDMSSYVGYSPFYCSTKFREHMGMTYKQFLSQCRLRAAANDLLNTDDKITDIAFRYGYSSSESLTRAFVSMFKCSPRQFRRITSGSFHRFSP